MSALSAADRKEVEDYCRAQKAKGGQFGNLGGRPSSDGEDGRTQQDKKRARQLGVKQRNEPLFGVKLKNTEFLLKRLKEEGI